MATKGAWMTEIREVRGSWACAVEVGEMPLAKGLRLTVEAAMLGREKDVACEVVGWEYRLGRGVDGTAAASATLEITVQEVEEPGLLAASMGWLERWYGRRSNNTQGFAPMLAGILTAFVLWAVVWTLFRQPDHGLVFVGKHIRTAVGWGIVGLFLVVLPWTLGLNRGERSFAKPFLSAMLTFSGFVALGCWLTFARYPAEFRWTDAEYVAYAKTLGTALSKSYWPIVAAALPWVTFSFKMFGLERAGKVSEGLEKLGKGKD